MTCRHALSLRDDFLDNELDAALAAELKAHLDGCPSCREEFAEVDRLRTLLSSQSSPEPRSDYWPEVTSLILAKTVESQDRIPAASSGSGTAERREFIRSALALAASVCILFGALYVGSHHQRDAKRLNPAGAPVLITSSLEGLVGDPNHALMTHKELVDIDGGRLLIGTPGPLGKGLRLVDLLTF